MALGNEIVLRTRGLAKRYGPRWAVADLDLDVVRGEVFGFLGPNGAGKTTTLACVLGLVRPNAGRIELFGQDTHQQLRPLLRRVGAMVEAPAFYPYLSGRDNLRVMARASGGTSEARLDEVLELVELRDRAKDRVKGYSQGMKQRLGLAAALLHRPDLVLLDEPTNGLDPAGQRDVRRLLRRLVETGHTVFLSSHLLHEIEQLCDRVAILQTGRVVAQGPVVELLSQGERLRVRVREEELGQARALLQTLPWVAAVMPSDGALLVDTPLAQAAELNAALARAGLYLSELTPVARSLESVFLQLTGEESTGAASLPDAPLAGGVRDGAAIP